MFLIARIGHILYYINNVRNNKPFIPYPTQ